MPNNHVTQMEQPLLRTKISKHQIPPEYVHRSRLTERIDRGVMGPLTVLSAPAGFGKTNLLIEWAELTALPVAWLNLESDDNDLGRFFRYLIGALQTLVPGLGEDALDFIQTTRSGGLEIGLTLLINEIAALPKEIVLVLDDFQTLEDVTIIQNVEFLIKHLPQNLHLILASRCEPGLDLADLQIKGKVVELDEDDLRFTCEEVVSFFQQAQGLQLPPETLQALEKRTDGWITGLQMAAILLRHRSEPVALLENFHGGAHILVDFLAEEVLDRQPEEIRQFLLRSSVLDRLCGALCEAVINPEAKPGYGQVMLNRLEHANLFTIALDEKHEWFRYHPLFVDFLRHIHREINPGEIPVLQKRAALWFEKRANLDEAFRYALASGDVVWTANLIERNLVPMIRTGEIFALTRWIGKLSDEVIHQRPGIGLAYAWGSIATYNLDNARYWIDDIQHTLDQIEKQTGTSDDAVTNEEESVKNDENGGLWNVRGGLAICQSTLAILSGDAELAAEYSRKAAGYLGQENPFMYSLIALEESLYFVLSGDTIKAVESLRNTIRIARQANNLLVMIIATCQLADVQALRGQLSQAWATLQKAQYMAIGPQGKPLPLAGLVDIGFGEILLERDALEDAKTFLERGCRSTQSMWWLGNLDGMISLARLHQIRGDISEAQATIAKASNMALSTESSQWDDIVVSVIAVREALRRDDLKEAIQWWKKSGFMDFSIKIHLENFPYHIYEYLLLTQVRLLTAVGISQENDAYLHRSIELLEDLMLDAERFQRVTSQIEILVLRAISFFALGDVHQAVDTLCDALALGEPEGYRRIFLDEGRPVAELLEYCLALSAESDHLLPSIGYVESLLAAFREEIGPAVTPASKRKTNSEPATAEIDGGLTVCLSSREMEVLALIAEGKSNQEISAQLYLALNTVKRHAYNIYAKLEVDKRTQAVSKARRLGLIP